jgi:hypothetical protein
VALPDGEAWQAEIDLAAAIAVSAQVADFEGVATHRV